MKINIEDVFNKSDLLTYVQLAGGKPDKSGGRYSCACPIHGGDNETAFSVYFDKGRWKWHCFTGNCGGGDVISFVEKWQRLNFVQACEFILGEKVSDPELLYKSASERLEEAHIEEQAARERKEARLKELQVAEKHLYYHKTRGAWARDMWNQRGLDDGIQDWFFLGACDDFSYKNKDVLYHSPTLSIPFLGEENELLYLQHRLVNPINPKDKYRPDMASREIDLPPFMAVPTMGLSFKGGLVIVVEGAIKAMVAWSRLTIADVQVIGTPTQGGYKNLTELLKDKKVIVIPDPKGNTTNENILRQPIELARATGGKLLTLPDKIDDYLVNLDVTPNGFYKLLQQARKP